MLLSIVVPDNWSTLLLPSTPILEIVIRGTVIYLALFFALRLRGRGDLSELGISDLLVIVLLADAVQNGMAGSYTSIFDALVLAGTLLGWNWLLAFFAYRSERLRPLIRPEPTLLIRQGRVNPRAVRGALLTRDEIMAQLREQGIERIEDVKEAYIETNGMITAIPLQDPGERKKRQRAVS